MNHAHHLAAFTAATDLEEVNVAVILQSALLFPMLPYEFLRNVPNTSRILTYNLFEIVAKSLYQKNVLKLSKIVLKTFQNLSKIVLKTSTFVSKMSCYLLFKKVLLLYIFCKIRKHCS